MSNVISIEEAQAKLSELISQLQPGDEIVITQNDQPVAEVRPISKANKPVFGRGKGLLVKEVDDQEYLDDFRDYMQ